MTHRLLDPLLLFRGRIPQGLMNNSLRSHLFETIEKSIIQSESRSLFKGRFETGPVGGFTTDESAINVEHDQNFSHRSLLYQGNRTGPLQCASSRIRRNRLP